MLGVPIDSKVQKTLNERKQVLKRNKNPYAQTEGKNPSKEIQKNLVKTPYINMLSSPKLVSPTNTLLNNDFPDGEDIILSNQEYKKDTAGNYNPINYGLELYSDIQKQGGKYKLKDDPNYQSQFKPQPGIISLTSEYQSTSNVYFVRNVSITWRCHHIDDLERLAKRFLTLQRLVYVEWGWNYADKKTATFINKENFDKIKNPKTLREAVLNEGEGNFDAVLGIISNFEWSSTGGGFECRTDIISQGADILSSRIDTDFSEIEEFNFETSKVKIGQNEGSGIKIMDSGGKDETYLEAAQNIARETNQELTGDYTIEERPNRPNNRVYSVKPTPINAEKGTTLIKTNPDGTLSIETDRGTQFEETFKNVMDNLHLKIQDLISSEKKSKSIVLNSKIIPTNNGDLEQRIKEAKEKQQEIYDETKKQVQEDYETALETKNWEKFSDYSRFRKNWRGRRVARNEDNVVYYETLTRFAEKVGIDIQNPFFQQRQTNTIQYAQDKAEQEATDKFLAEKGEIIDIARSKDNEIFYNKNFVQKQTNTYEYSNKTDFVYAMGQDLSPTDYSRPEPLEIGKTTSSQTWVRWGWFEDNILNKFFGLLTHDKKPMLEIRSVREGIFEADEEFATATQEYIETEQANPVQERINSHPDLLTEDINKFILPGKFKIGDAEITKQRFEENYKTFKQQGFVDKEIKVGNAKSEELATSKLMLQRNDNKYTGQGTLLLSSEDFNTLLSNQSTPQSNLSSMYRIEDEELRRKIATKEFQKETESYRYLKTLSDIFSKNQIASFESPESEYRGILRNVFINVNHLQSCFENMITLGGAIKQLLDSFNSTSPVFSLIPIINTPENDGQLLFTDASFLRDDEVPDETIYKFPIKTTDSFVKSTTIASDITNEGNKLLLSKRYSKTNTDIINVANGANIAAHLNFDGFDSIDLVDGSRVDSFPGIPPYQFAYLGEPYAKYGQKDGDYKKSLTLDGGVDFGSISNDKIAEKIKNNAKQRNENSDGGDKSVFADSKFVIEFPSNYTEYGQLKSPIKQVNDEKQLGGKFKEASAYDELGLTFITNTLSIDGIAGIFPSNLYTSAYLPDKFRRVDAKNRLKCYFFTQGVNQTIDSSTWTTEIQGRVLWRFKSKTGNLDSYDKQETERAQ
jgi:hypothetical protein